MHIGFITSHFPFRNAKSVGGIGTSIKNLSDELIILGHQVTVFVYGQEKDEKYIDEEITILTVKNIKLKGLSWYLTRKKIQKKINELKLDIVEAPDWEGITSFVKTKCPLIIKLHGSDTYFCHLDNRKVKTINKFHEKRAFKNANAIIAVSSFTGKITNELFATKKPFQVIPNAVNVAKFDSDSTENNSKIILYFGGIIRKKGLLEIPYYFNKVVKEIPDAKLIIIGQDMRDIISGSNSTIAIMNDLFDKEAIKRVTFLGSVPYQEIKKHIQEAAICIFPSFAEALPVSWIEAMAMKKPIVASNIGWASEIIDDEIDGFLENPKNHNSFALKMISLLKNNDLKQQIGVAARKKIISKFSTQVVANQHIEFYNKIIENEF